VITLEQHLFALLKKKYVTSNYARTNNVWNGGIIDIRDGYDLINVVFQSRDLNRIIVGLEIFGPFKKLHQKDKENFIMNVIRAITGFLIHEERL
jgi:hypothetical protein